ncbi:DNA gyrase inhibitor YacG [Spongiibacter sp. UBA1325]|uniref:DNA gyrase inhibitor YacG n=1 Tax=Spongiibacter sp. UBA1325 TaxID=1947543 RepID=UPI0032E4741B
MSTANKPTTLSTIVPCPICGAKLKWDSGNPYRPFCSENCKNQDFVAWSNEEHHIPGQPDYEDILSGDLNDDYKPR